MFTKDLMSKKKLHLIVGQEQLFLTLKQSLVMLGCYQPRSPSACYIYTVCGGGR